MYELLRATTGPRKENMKTQRKRVKKELRDLVINPIQGVSLWGLWGAVTRNLDMFSCTDAIKLRGYTWTSFCHVS